MDMQQFNQRYINNPVSDEALILVKNRLNTNDITINTTAINNINTFAEEWSPDGDYNFYPYFKLNKTTFKIDMIKQETQYRTKWEKDFEIWKAGKSITNPENIFSYGQYSLTDWNYSGLTLKTIDIPVTVSLSTTRELSVSDMANKMSELWASNGLLPNNSKFWGYDGEKSIRWSMNTTDFKSYANDGSKWFDVLNYLSDKIKALAINKNILTADDSIKITTSRIDRNDKKSNFVLKENKKDDNTVYKDLGSGSWHYMYISLNGYRMTLSPKEGEEQRYITINTFNW